MTVVFNTVKDALDVTLFNAFNFTVRPAYQQFQHKQTQGHFSLLVYIFYDNFLLFFSYSFHVTRVAAS